VHYITNCGLDIWDFIPFQTFFYLCDCYQPEHYADHQLSWAGSEYVEFSLRSPCKAS